MNRSTEETQETFKDQDPIIVRNASTAHGIAIELFWEFYTPAVSEFVNKNLHYFFEEGAHRENAFAELEKFIQADSVKGKIRVIICVVSALIQKKGDETLKKELYFNFGNFVYKKVLCLAFGKLATKSSAEQAVALMQLSLAIRSIFYFDGGALFSDFNEHRRSNPAALLSCLKKCTAKADYLHPKKFLEELSMELLAAALIDDIPGRFYTKLFFEGHLLGHLIRRECNFALDLGAFAFLLLRDDIGSDWLVQLKKESEGELIEYPTLLIQALREIIKCDERAPLLEIAIKNYDGEAKLKKQRAHHQLNEEEGEFSALNEILVKSGKKPLENSCNEQIQNIAIPVLSFPLQNSGNEFVSPERVKLMRVNKNPARSRPQFISSHIRLNSILRHIYDKTEKWDSISESIKQLISLFPNEASRVISKVAYELIRHRWDCQFKEFIQTYLYRFPGSFWDRIFDLRRFGELLKTLNLIMALFETEKEDEVTFYCRDQIISRLAVHQNRILTKLDGELLSPLIERIFKTFQQSSPQSSLFEKFIMLTSFIVEHEGQKYPTLNLLSKELAAQILARK